MNEQVGEAGRVQRRAQREERRAERADRRTEATPRGRRGHEVGEAERTRDTRSQIQAVALELFIEQGYEQTSLREIAERLGVTKAALYYHFKTKDEIVESLTEDRIAKIEEIIEWARTQHRTLDFKREFLRRYSENLHNGRHHDVMRFFERNQAAMKGMAAAEKMRGRMREILDFLSNPADPLPVQIKCTLALFALHSTWFVVRDPAVSDEQLAAAALDVAYELISNGSPS
jgi:AcrR family transcriptional regulator